MTYNKTNAKQVILSTTRLSGWFQAAEGLCLVLFPCDVRAGKINLPEFIAKCPAHCKETKQQVYGTGVFASISSICNAAIHRCLDWKMNIAERVS
uniref:LCCL domain-containing protein n=1 Tax=Xiphophorus couchianus TaxID=32473 RepID=A0A3B5LFI2_9TELE